MKKVCMRGGWSTLYGKALSMQSNSQHPIHRAKNVQFFMYTQPAFLLYFLQPHSLQAFYSVYVAFIWTRNFAVQFFFYIKMLMVVGGLVVLHIFIESRQKKGEQVMRWKGRRYGATGKRENILSIKCFVYKRKKKQQRVGIGNKNCIAFMFRWAFYILSMEQSKLFVSCEDSTAF